MDPNKFVATPARTRNLKTLPPDGWPGIKTFWEACTPPGSHQSSLQLPTRAQQRFSLTLALVKLNRLSSTPQGFFGDLSGVLASPLHPLILPGPPGAPREARQPRSCSLNPRAWTLEPRPSSFPASSLDARLSASPGLPWLLLGPPGRSWSTPDCPWTPLEAKTL